MTEMIYRSFSKRIKIEASLLSYDPERVVRVGMLVDASIDMKQLLEHVEWMFVTPSIGGLYFVWAMMKAGEVNAIAFTPQVLRMAEGIKIPYPVREGGENLVEKRH